MFAIGISGFNINEGDRWFDILMQYRSYGPNKRNITIMELVPCKKQQWTFVNASFEETYERLGFDNWLCPKNGTEFQLQGKYTSKQFKFYRFSVKQCDPSLDVSRPCVNNSTIQDYLNRQEAFNFNFYFVNPVINGGIHEYLNYYLEDMNYFPFSITEGVNANLFMATYTITTDESISPVEDVRTEKGGIIPNLAQIHNYEILNDAYVKFYLRKSSQDILVQRSFRKVDDTLSYIGGLFSTLLFILIIMVFFNQFSYELELTRSLYYYDKNEPIDADGFNFLVYLGYLIYNGFDKVGIDLPWTKMRKYHHALHESRKQLDIRLILKKVLYAQKLATAVLDQHKGKVLHLQEPLTLEEAEEIRKDHDFYENLQKYYFNEVGELQTEEKLRPSETQSENRIFENMEDWQSQDEEEEEEKKEYEKMIKKIRNYVNVLENEVEKGDKVSKRILEKFDNRVQRCRKKKRKGTRKATFSEKNMND